MSRYKKDLSDSEIELSQRSLMEELRKGFVKHDTMHFEPEYAAKQKPKSRKRKKVKQGGQAHHGTQANTQSGNQGSNASRGQTGQDNTAQIIEGGIDYLENVYAKPNSSLKARGFELGLSADKRTAIKNDLVRNGFVIEFSVDLGKEFGGRVKMLKLTEKGNKAIGNQMEGPYPNGNESLEHLWWKVHLANDYAQRGYRVNIEKMFNGKAADVCVSTNNELVAIEVELTPRNVVYNLKTDIDVGFSRVIVACKNTAVKKEAEKQIKAFVKNNPSYEGRYKIYLLKDYPFVKRMMKEVRGE